MAYSDGTFTSAVQNGPKQIFYPFLNSPTKDSTTKGTIRNYVVFPNSYSPAAALSTDPDDATQYLIEETEPQIESAVARYQRVYCKVPSDQIIYGSRVITKPSVTSLGAVSAGSVSSNGGTFLASGYSYAGYLFYLTKVYGLTTSVSYATVGGVTRVTWTSHGLTGSEDIILLYAGSFNVEFGSGQYTIIDSNTIDLNQVFTGSGGTGRKYYRNYTSGTDRVGTKDTQKFYLPTVTSGITTAADIPIPSTLLNDVDFMSSVLANTTGYQTYDASELRTWRGPIYTQTLTEINMADV